MTLSSLTSSDSDLSYLTPPYDDILAESKMPKFNREWVPESIAVLRVPSLSGKGSVPIFERDVHLTESQVTRIQSLFDSNGRMIDSASETDGGSTNELDAEEQAGDSSLLEQQNIPTQWVQVSWDDLEVPMIEGMVDEDRTPSPVSLDDPKDY